MAIPSDTPLEALVPSTFPKNDNTAICLESQNWFRFMIVSMHSENFAA